MIKAYQLLGESDAPKFTVIVAQKRHHTKLFQANGPENVPSGTVVDNNVVHPRNYDFYMCTQPGMIGTSRPAHYHVLLDEIGFSPDALQNLILNLSYVSQRGSAATSIALLLEAKLKDLSKLVSNCLPIYAAATDGDDMEFLFALCHGCALGQCGCFCSVLGLCKSDTTPSSSTLRHASSNILAFFILLLIGVLAFSIRLFSVTSIAY